MKASNEDPSTAELDAAIQQIHKQFGAGAIQRMNDDDREPVPHRSTGLTGLDIALGIGGLPKGRIIEIYGPESSGKTTLTLQAIAATQDDGGTCAFIDAEHAFDPAYASALGVRVGELLVSQPDCGEQGLEITDILARSGAVDLIVVDSVAALTPRAEIEGHMGDAHMGLQARLMSQALRKITATASRKSTTVLFINQLRHKIGVTFGSNETTTGGNALKFYCSVRIDVRRIGAIKEGPDAIGNRTRVKVVKNKVAPPFKQVELDLYYGEGLCPVSDLLSLALEAELMDRRGSWIRFQGEQVGQGRNAARAWLRDHPEVMTGLRSAVLERAGIAAAPRAEAPSRSAAA
jgi:recombination protein RecA